MMEDFTNYDIKPKDFLNYLRYYGEHFNKKLCLFACELMEGTVYSRERLDDLLNANNITIEGGKLCDDLYVFNWITNTYYNYGIGNESDLALFVKTCIEREGELIFNRWYADMAKRGIPIEWENMI